MALAQKLLTRRIAHPKQTAIHARARLRPPQRVAVSHRHREPAPRIERQVRVPSDRFARKHRELGMTLRKQSQGPDVAPPQEGGLPQRQANTVVERVELPRTTEGVT